MPFWLEFLDLDDEKFAEIVVCSLIKHFQFDRPGLFLKIAYLEIVFSRTVP